MYLNIVNLCMICKLRISYIFLGNDLRTTLNLSGYTKLDTDFLLQTNIKPIKMHYRCNQQIQVFPIIPLQFVQF